jgi:hypothetical protein
MQMIAQRLTIRELDSICRDFELNWHAGSPLDSIRTFAGSHLQPESESFPDLLLDLVYIDIEKRWSARNERLNATLRRGAKLSEKDLVLPEGHDAYLRLFDGQATSPDLVQAVIQAELKARWEFGDVPELEIYTAASAGTKRPEIAIPVLKLHKQGNVLYQLELTGRLLVGRQGLSEPPPFSLHCGTQRKLICSELLDTSTSRTQLELESVSRDLIRITNLSSNRNLSLGEGRNLAPKETQITSHHQPLQIFLKNFSLVVTRE